MAPLYFAVMAYDRHGVAELRTRLRPEHRAWLRNPGHHRIVTHLGGPLLDAEGNMHGTLLVIEASSKAAVEDFLRDDPYCRNDLFQKIEISQWQWSLGQPQGALENAP